MGNCLHEPYKAEKPQLRQSRGSQKQEAATALWLGGLKGGNGGVGTQKPVCVACGAMRGGAF